MSTKYYDSTQTLIIIIICNCVILCSIYFMVGCAFSARFSKYPARCVVDTCCYDTPHNTCHVAVRIQCNCTPHDRAYSIRIVNSSHLEFPLREHISMKHVENSVFSQCMCKGRRKYTFRYVYMFRQWKLNSAFHSTSAF